MRPTIIEGTDPGHEVFTTEYFGPVLAVHVYEDADYDAVLAQMESVAPYALTGLGHRAGPGGHRPRPGVPALRGGQLLRQRQADRRRRRAAAVRRRPGVGHQRQGRRRAEPDALDEHPCDQGDVRPAHRPPLPAHGVADYSVQISPSARAGQLRTWPSAPSTAPSAGWCGVSRPPGMRCCTGTPRPTTATSAINRRWQRHQTLSLHITATVDRRRLGQHLVERSAELRRPGVGGIGGELGDGPPAVVDRIRRAAAGGDRRAAPPTGSRRRRRGATPRGPRGGDRGARGCPGSGARRPPGPPPRRPAARRARRGPGGRDPR